MVCPNPIYIMQMNGRKLVMHLETDVGIELPLTSFDVTLAWQLSNLVCSYY